MLINKIREEMNKALKEGNYNKKNVYSSMVGALTNAIKDNKNQPLTKEQETQTILRMLKQTKETLESCPSEREDIINRCNFEISIFSNYLPKQMDEVEIRKVIEKVLKELNLFDTVTIKNKGVVMKTLMPLVKGKADGKFVNQILESYFH